MSRKTEVGEILTEPRVKLVAADHRRAMGLGSTELPERAVDRRTLGIFSAKAVERTRSDTFARPLVTIFTDDVKPVEPAFAAVQERQFDFREIFAEAFRFLAKLGLQSWGDRGVVQIVPGLFEGLVGKGFRGPMDTVGAEHCRLLLRIRDEVATGTGDQVGSAGDDGSYWADLINFRVVQGALHPLRHMLIFCLFSQLARLLRGADV